MANVVWPLAIQRPVVYVVLTATHAGPLCDRILLADTGAGTAGAPFELILRDRDWNSYGTRTGGSIRLSGAYAGIFPVALVRVRIPALGFDHHVRAVGVPSPPGDLDGIAGFRFLNRFTYGNFGDAQQFGLEL